MGNIGLGFLAGLSAGIPSNEPSSSEIKKSGRFKPLKEVAAPAVEFPAVLGEVPGDFEHFDCDDAEETLRVILNPSDDDWIYPGAQSRRQVPSGKVLTDEEVEIEESRRALTSHIPERLCRFIRHSAINHASVELRGTITESSETIGYYGPSLDKTMLVCVLAKCMDIRFKELEFSPVKKLFGETRDFRRL